MVPSGIGVGVGVGVIEGLGLVWGRRSQAKLLPTSPIVASPARPRNKVRREMIRFLLGGGIICWGSTGDGIARTVAAMVAEEGVAPFVGK